ncbi:MAG: amylo-alpha-1,6-glucosidase [Deltaproteobacteria bacterium]|nr:amylo-alpha-1,6-glucosidase [Deltaproteobacteria bacterium]
MDVIRIGLADGDLPEIEREWLETDGRGGYASSTLSGCHTRSYHGLQVANLRSPEGRHVLLSKLEDSFILGNGEFFLTCHRYPDVLFPPGPSCLREFLVGDPLRFSYQAGGTRMKKEVMRLPDGDTVLVRYELESPPEKGRLRLKPFLAFRGFHRLSHENPFFRGRIERIENGFRIEPYEGMPPLFIRTSTDSECSPRPLWYRRFEYDRERERGFEHLEDLFCPGILETPIEAGSAVILVASCTLSEEDLNSLWREESERRRLRRHKEERGAEGFDGGDREMLLALLRAGQQFLITTPSGRPAVIAGYPWFESWGRDTLIALPGLAFRSGHLQEGIAILDEIGRHEREGLLPNFFSADGQPAAYNTVDSSLLYFWTVQELLGATGDWSLIQRLFWPVMKRIVGRFRGGTRFGTAMDGRGLLHAGDRTTALTWMDATVQGVPVTPRNGCAVEINALWYNALRFTDKMGERFGDPVPGCRELIPLVRRSFRETFWNPQAQCLGDVFYEGALDTAIRPNQIFAVSLPFSPLEPEEQAAVVGTVRSHLLTPCGLRTLAPADPAYRGRYRGSGPERDAAYHQGTVWPWLLGPFGEAAIRVAVDRNREREALMNHLRIFLSGHLTEAGIGSVSEVFDGDPPHWPGGCIAQAWSVAELIRLFFLLRDRGTGAGGG